MLGDIETLFDKSFLVWDEHRMEHQLVRLVDLAAFFGVSPQVVHGWEKKGALKPYYTGLSRKDRRKHMYDLGVLFTPERRLRFMPPSYGNLLENCMDRGEDVEELLKFLTSLPK